MQCEQYALRTASGTAAPPRHAEPPHQHAQCRRSAAFVRVAASQHVPEPVTPSHDSVQVARRQSAARCRGARQPSCGRNGMEPLLDADRLTVINVRVPYDGEIPGMDDIVAYAKIAGASPLPQHRGFRAAIPRQVRGDEYAGGGNACRPERNRRVRTGWRHGGVGAIRTRMHPRQPVLAAPRRLINSVLA